MMHTRLLTRSRTVMGTFAFFSLFSLAVIGCGEDESGDGEEREDTVERTEVPTPGTTPNDTVAPKPPASDSVAPKPANDATQQKIEDEYLASRRRLVEIIEGIRTEGDVRKESSAMAGAYSQIAKVITKYQGKSAALKSAHTSPDMQALDQRVATHIRQLGSSNPAALRALTESMKKNGASLARLENKVLNEVVRD